ncbi:MAG: acyloxyacyl hydrolase [Bdellovibrionales bacterium]|nr:acyloxyacyl hydrolase [Bdellovibrionales bacterium]
MQLILLVLAALWAPDCVHAEESGLTRKSPDWMVRYGVVSDEDKLSAWPGTKLFSVTRRSDYKWQAWQVELGGIFENRAGMKGQGFISFAAGIETQTLPLRFFYLPGVALVSATDPKLSSFWQFSHDLGFFWRDHRGIAIGMQYRHFSNAGLHLPNGGKNFLQLSLSVPASELF